MLEAIYITDTKNVLAFEYLTSPDLPHFSSVLSLVRSSLHKEDDGISIVQSSIPLIRVNDAYYICSSTIEGLQFYLLFRSSSVEKTNPLVPTLFIDRMVSAFKEYLGSPLTVSKVDASTDTLTLLLHEMIDVGIPNATDANKLRDLVQSKSLLSKILSSGNDIASAASKGTLTSLSNMSSHPSAPLSQDPEGSVPWRRANVKYTNNEMYIDLFETVNVILRPKRRSTKVPLLSQNFDSAFYSSSATAPIAQSLIPHTGTIIGQLDFLCRLSGEPTLQITLNAASSFIDATQCHPCINFDTWNRNHETLSFIPPDGHSSLISYQVDLDELPERDSRSMLGLFTFDCHSNLGMNESEFEIRAISSKCHGVSKIDTLKIEIFAYEPSQRAHMKSDDDADDEPDSNIVDSIKAIKVTHGDFRYKGNGRGEWIMKDLVPGTQPVFRGCINTFDDEYNISSSPTPLHENLIEVSNDSSNSEVRRAIAPLFYKVSFSYKGGLASGLKVDGLKVLRSKGMGDSVKPYKGVRYITTTGDYVIRT
ncbi:hypothetical protein CJI97_000520 [Candidozyma auris]|nr:hypothetical protein CJI97_000520 [[Candida] auris]